LQPVFLAAGRIVPQTKAKVTPEMIKNQPNLAEQRGQMCPKEALGDLRSALYMIKYIGKVAKSGRFPQDGQKRRREEWSYS
jgi:hypothetical protein